MAKPPTFEPPEKQPLSPVFWKCQRCKGWFEETVVATTGPFTGERLCAACTILQESAP